MPKLPNPVLLFGLLAAACASGAAPKEDPGYDLSYHGSEVSLSLRRGLSMPEFLALAQQVTQAVYTYRLDEVADLGPVTFQGRVRCERVQFGDFVQTMLHLHGLRLATSPAPGGPLEVKTIPTRG